jgi:hypothetical protein
MRKAGFNAHRRQYKSIRVGEDVKVRRSPQAVACRKRGIEELGRPQRLLGKPGRRRSTVTGKARRMRLGSRIEQSTQRWGKPPTRGRSRRKHAARKGNSSRTCWTGSVCANLPAGHSKQGTNWQRFCLARKRVQPRNRMRENCTSGSARGAPGNRRSYRGGVQPRGRELLPPSDHKAGGLRSLNRVEIRCRLDTV